MNTCVFCKIAAHSEPAYIVYEDSLSCAFLDKFPQTRGQIQLIPRKHYSWIYELPEIGQFFTTAGKIIRAIIPVLGADHVTIASFGHQIKHAHIWIVPQYVGLDRVTEEGGRLKNSEQQESISSLLRRTLMKEVF